MGVERGSRGSGVPPAERADNLQVLLKGLFVRIPPTCDDGASHPSVHVSEIPHGLLEPVILAVVENQFVDQMIVLDHEGAIAIPSEPQASLLIDRKCSAQLSLRNVLHRRFYGEAFQGPPHLEDPLEGAAVAFGDKHAAAWGHPDQADGLQSHDGIADRCNADAPALRHLSN